MSKMSSKDYEMMMDVARHFSTRRSITSSGMLAFQETVRTKLLKFREQRQNRRQAFQPVYRYVCEVIALYLGVDLNEIIEGVLDSQRHLDLLENLTKKDGDFCVVFYWQNGPLYELETGRLAAVGLTSLNRLYLASKNSPLMIKNKAIIAYRLQNVGEIDLRNINEEIFFVQLEGNESFHTILSQLFYPTITLPTHWGNLLQNKDGRLRKINFEGDFQSLVQYLKQTSIDLAYIRGFAVDEELAETISQEKDESLNNRQIVRKVEGVVRHWIKVIERCLVQYKQVRYENEFVGPKAELEYWRRQLVRFTCIIDFIESPSCELFLNFLEEAKSKILKSWNEFKDKAYNSKYECADIVKYLYNLEQFWEPLYNLQPEELAPKISILLEAIRMVFTTSRYYNNTFNMTAILIKISNQLIINCRNFINCSGRRTVWNQKKKVVLEKIKICLDLYSNYYETFKNLQENMQKNEEKSFGCSETSIFGKFETFKIRLERIVDVLSTTVKYSILQQSTIEGIDVFAIKFQSFFEEISHKNYDALNHRLKYFDEDYVSFKKNVAGQEWNLEEFVGRTLGRYSDLDNVLRVIRRFEKVDLECLHLDERYLEAMEMFREEMGELRDKYNLERENPLLPWNMPPVSGRIMWIRQFYGRICNAMEMFKKQSRVMRHRKVQKTIQLFNALSLVFIQYEKLYHDSWFVFSSQVKACLECPVLSRKENGNYEVNFNSYIINVIREAEFMYKLDLPVPEVAKVLVFCKEQLYNSREMLKKLVEKNEQVRLNILPLFHFLSKGLLLEIEDAFKPAFSTITWTSMQIQNFCLETNQVLRKVELFIKEVQDMKDARIDLIFEQISRISLVYLPESAVTPEEFVRKNNEHYKQIAKEIEQKSVICEKVTIELINKFLVSFPIEEQSKFKWLDSKKILKATLSSTKLPHEDVFKEIDRNVLEDLPNIHKNCLEIFSHFHFQLLDCLVKATKSSLEKLKKRATSLGEKSLMITELKLQIPQALITPNLHEMQHSYTQVCNNILEAFKFVSLWGQKRTTSEQIFNFYKIISENRDVHRILLSLQGALFMVHPDLVRLREGFLKFSFLWVENREEIITGFCNLDPLVVEIEEKFLEYESWNAMIASILDFNDVGAIRINLKSFKLALSVESQQWKTLLGKTLILRYKKKLNEMVDFIKTREKILEKPIKDLDDCRLAMQCLETIRENFIEMDMDLTTIEEVYSIFSKFKIYVSKEDIDRVESLRFVFQNMILHAKQVQETICQMQEPLLQELTEGVVQFQIDLDRFIEDFDLNGPMQDDLPAQVASDLVLVFQDRFEDLWRKYEMYKSGEILFGLPVKEYPILHEKKKELNLLNKLYSLYLQVNHSIESYYEINWIDFDSEKILKELENFQNRCQKLPKDLKSWPAYEELKKKIDDFTESCPILELISDKSLKDRHFKAISTLLNSNLNFDSAGFTLKDLLEAPLLEFKSEIEDICLGAVKEQEIEGKLKQVIVDWSLVELSFSHLKSRGEILLKGQETGEIIGLLEDSLMVMNSLLNNRFNVPFKKEIQKWIKKLVETSEILEKWIFVQNLYIYLEAVFVGGDIAKQLPAEAKRFNNIDKTWNKIMLRAHDITNAVECCTGDETMSQFLPHILEQLELCQKSLSGYLEEKRAVFPRFSFISDTILLEILGQSSQVTSIQTYLPSLFDAVFQVEFSHEKNDFILAILSDLGEKIALEKTVECIGGVENWLNTLLLQVQETVKSVIASQAQCLKNTDYDFVLGFVDFPGQAGVLGLQLLWTKEAELALSQAKSNRNIMKLTNERFLLLLNSLIELTLKNLNKMQRIRFETMVIIQVHQRDIFDKIFSLKVRNLWDFEWQQQARFYYDEETDDVIVRITDVTFLYQNEYLGITERLAITPLTDRCYITLAQAIWINMGGAPAGPAGTGKTETVKDMGRTLGKYVVVFNCSDQMDFRGLGRIFKGLAQSGSWGCFDEFNRIELPVLSVAAQQISIVLIARKEKRKNFIFMDGSKVSLNPELGIFLTMNPGYAGRQELPENLKIMFRNVAMMVPDRQIIIRVKLASCGFKENLTLARKFFVLYKLCEEQLSKQVHYDFGLRNILSVLRTLGGEKRKNPQDSEEKIVMRVLRDMNLSKLIDEDEPLFLSLIDDMFPGNKIHYHAEKELQKNVEIVLEEMGLKNYFNWNLKLVQLYESSLVRHGLMVMGPSGAGKSSCIRCLIKSLNLTTGLFYKETRMNPKAITASQMFGKLDVATNDWTDGIFSVLWRRTLKLKKNEFCWLILDGPVDAVWIENLNSVLDDNKTLTLANGDRIVMSPNCKLLFEPDQVDNASPATVSRMGMVFMSSSVLPWNIILESYLKKRTKFEAEVLLKLFQETYEELKNFVLNKLTPKMNLNEALYIRQTCDVLQGLLLKENLTKNELEKIFLFAVIWSLGALLEDDQRALFQEFLFKLKPDCALPKLQEEETIFQFFFEQESGTWRNWKGEVETFVFPVEEDDFTSILVPNMDNVRMDYLVELIAKQNKPVLFIGEQGTGKTTMLKSYTKKFDIETQTFKSFNFSSATTPNMVQKIIESFVEKRLGTTYGPPAGKRLTIFIDDINMPLINTWGDQITNEIVRQLMENGGFYCLEKPGEFSFICDVDFLGAMCHPGGGRNDIPQRLKRQFCIFNCTLPSNFSLDQIFKQIGMGYFSPGKFNEEIVELVPNLVELTRKVWLNTKKKMLPTPSKFHYVFNLRDLSRIWQGMLTINPEECSSSNDLINLWQHEVQRVISDRFTNIKDRLWFEKLLKNELLESFGFEFPEEEVYFVDFLREAPEATGEEPDDFDFSPPKIYEQLPSLGVVKDKIMEFIQKYNEQMRSGKIDLVMFEDAIKHLMKISRVLRSSKGNALLVGVGGSGKQSLTRLASFIAGYKTFQIELSRSYNLMSLMEDLKKLYLIAGLEGQGVTFLFTENEIKDETFLESLNNILSSGEIANLFAKDEMDEILSNLTPIMKKTYPRKVVSNENLYEFFLNRAKANLHCALCFSPVGESFRNRALKFPGLISGCTIDWFFSWPQDALVQVSQHFLRNFKIICSEEIKDELYVVFANIQEQVSQTCIDYFNRFRRQIFVTPKTYITFLQSYKELYTNKLQEIDTLDLRMKNGLEKLIEAKVKVDELKEELQVKEVEVDVATKEAEKVLDEVLEAKKIATKIQDEALVVKTLAEKLVEDISFDQKIAEEKLEKAQPALQAAEEALLTIKAADISTIRKLGKPPYLITLIMDAVLVYFRRKLDPIKVDLEKNFLVASWNESLKVLADTSFLRKLQDFKKDTINEEMMDLLNPYFNFAGYTFEAAKIACGNVAGLLNWTIAMSAFYEINKEVLPLKTNLFIQKAKLEKASKELAEAMQLLSLKEEEVRVCQEQYDEAMLKKKIVFEEASKIKSKMDNATNLIDGLTGERVRWSEQILQFKSQSERLIGDVVVLTAFLVYSGPFNQEFRKLLMENWFENLIVSRIPVTISLNLVENLTDLAMIGEWNLHGLPTDDLSLENAIIVTKSSRFPLIIDPQSQGKTWIYNKEKNNQIIVTNFDSKYFRNHLENAVSLGQPLIIENILESLDPILNNLLEKNFIKMGSLFKVKLGDKEVDYNFQFRLFMTTKLLNPNFSPEIFGKTSLVDFTVTRKGLEDQLLTRVILHEKKDLENERTNLLVTITQNRRKIQDLEANLLLKLTTIQGSLLEDDSLIEVLNVTKNTAKEVQEKLLSSKETQDKINVAREEFRPVACRGSILYFLVVNMSLVNLMYQTSLGQFLERFNLSLEQAQKSPVTSKRISFINDFLTYEIFKYKTRGLYNKDKYLFVLLMALNLDLEKGLISFEEFDYFIKGGASLDLSDCPAKPALWISDLTWLNLVGLSKLDFFSNLIEQVINNHKMWKVWLDKEGSIPEGYNTMDNFKKLLLIRAWSPERTIKSSKMYVESNLGSKFVETVILNLRTIFLESKLLTPIICFLSIGSDPTPFIEILGKNLGVKTSCLSMGQGQEIHARKLIEMALKEGFWSVLQNCHLSLDYMAELMDLLMTVEEETINPDFRLWLTTEENPNFPINLLQICLKFTNEAPSGIKAGLLKTYNSINQDFLDYSDSWQYLPMIFAVSFLHTILQERRKFGPLGWNIPYEFNSSDWLASCLFVQNFLEEIDAKRGLNWNTLRYMLGEVHYGGRVTDDFDKRLLKTFCKTWFNEQMFNENFEFHKNYKILRFKFVGEYFKYLEELPLNDPAQVYGLHPNADITYEANTTKVLFETMQMIQPKDSGLSQGVSREKFVENLSKDFLLKLPQSYDLKEVKSKLKLSPLNIFLKQELGRMQIVLEFVKKTLTELLLAIEGTIIMNDFLKDCLNNLYDGKVPENFTRISWNSTTLGFWFSELLLRDAQFKTWLLVGRPAGFLLGGFFNPQGFLTGMRQEVARLHKWPLDCVEFCNEVTKMNKEDLQVNASLEGVLVYGLSLEGASWDKRRMRLCESCSKILYAPLPVVRIFAINSLEPINSSSSRLFYTCPVYKKPQRTDLNYIISLILNTSKPPEHWILRGVALLCDVQ